MERKINNVIKVSAPLEGKFFEYWLSFIKPLHKLTSREIEVAAAFLKQRFNLSKVISDQELLDKNVMSDDIKRKVREDCNITQAHFQVVMSELKKNKFIVNGRINPKFIPKLTEGSEYFQLMLLFELK